MFQSTPAITGGRDLSLLSDEVRANVVSIHARHYWRARPPLAARRPPWPGSFNPRPPLLAGETDLIRANRRPTDVSIHARHYWRARPGAATITSQAFKFQSTPPLLAGETWITLRQTRLAEGFNPRPPLLAGETLAEPSPVAAPNCFNPRPPLLAGEAAMRWIP